MLIIIQPAAFTIGQRLLETPALLYFERFGPILFSFFRSSVQGIGGLLLPRLFPGRHSNIGSFILAMWPAKFNFNLGILSLLMIPSIELCIFPRVTWVSLNLFVKVLQWEFWDWEFRLHTLELTAQTGHFAF